MSGNAMRKGIQNAERNRNFTAYLEYLAEKKRDTERKQQRINKQSNK